MAEFGISRTNDDRNSIPSNLDAQYTTFIQKTKCRAKKMNSRLFFGWFLEIFCKNTELSVAWTRKDRNFVLADLDAQYTTFIQKLPFLGLKMKFRLVLAHFWFCKNGCFLCTNMPSWWKFRTNWFGLALYNFDDENLLPNLKCNIWPTFRSGLAILQKW